jgi:hypothetical protein
MAAAQFDGTPLGTQQGLNTGGRQLSGPIWTVVHARWPQSGRLRQQSNNGGGQLLVWSLSRSGMQLPPPKAGPISVVLHFTTRTSGLCPQNFEIKKKKPTARVGWSKVWSSRSRTAASRPHGRRAAKQRNELAAPHSITSSARASSVGGAVRPSALAVVKLMMRSNLVGCSTGSSAGFAPRRILSTESDFQRGCFSPLEPRGIMVDPVGDTAYADTQGQGLCDPTAHRSQPLGMGGLCEQR